MGSKECETLSEDGRLKDMLQLLKEQSVKIEKLSLTLKVIQDGMLRNTLVAVQTNVGKAAEVMKIKVNPLDARLKVLTIRRARKEGIFLVLKKGRCLGL